MKLNSKCILCFFLSSRRRHTISYGDWSSDVCSSDLRPSGNQSTSIGPPRTIEILGPRIRRTVAAPRRSAVGRAASLPIMLACDRCGRSNDDDAHFCQACGASLRVETPQQERKLISVLFVDIVGSTARADRADPEDIRDRVELFYDSFRIQTERFGGTVEKFIGDAGVSVFGAPLAHGDDAERAVRC